MADEFGVNDISSPVINSLRGRYLGDYRPGSGFMLGGFSVALRVRGESEGVLSPRSGRSPKHDVLRQIVRQGMALVAMGAVAGLVISRAGAALVSGILVGVDATDPAVYAGVTLLLLIVAGAANYLPARRAASLDPARALRGD